MIFKTAAASLAILAIAAAPAAARDNSISVNGINVDKETFFEDLVALDADDIAEMRDDFADARADIRDAIGDIDEAREDVKGVPGGNLILKIAFATASATVSATTGSVLEEVDDLLDDAQARLVSGSDNLDAAETAETQDAIDTIRDGLDEIRAGLDELAAAMRA